jgi:SAM-dependent methyltransferase
MPSDLAPFYRGYHGARHGSSAQICIRRRIAILFRSAHMREPGSLLDIGCGDGSFLLAARKRGWRVFGTELNPQDALRNGLSVVTDINDAIDSAPFDCITLWHSLEHLRDPLNTLKTIRRLLSPTGVLIIAVPDNGGLQATLFGRSWVHLDVPRHLYHFGKDSLSMLLQATGFAPFRWRHQEFEYDLLGWSQSALNRVLPTPNVFFHLLMGRSVGCSLAEKGSSYLGGTALTLLALPLVALGTLVGRGGSVLVAAHPSEPSVP